QKGSVATKYGTRQQYIDACSAVRSAGLNLIVDIVLNHMGGAEETELLTVREVDPDDRRKFVSDPYEIEAYTKFTFPACMKRNTMKRTSMTTGMAAMIIFRQTMEWKGTRTTKQLTGSANNNNGTCCLPCSCHRECR
ncbi:MAG: hypothetical protein EOO05_16600, partial [Chitinophagaceae bacterium]